jgi:hypothetical protein
VRVKQEPLPVKVKQEQQLQDRAERRRSIGEGTAAAVCCEGQRVALLQSACV